MPFLVAFFLITFLCPAESGHLTDSRKEAVRLQIYLDQQNFGPGLIDGKMGTYTRKAVEAYNSKHGNPQNDWLGVQQLARQEITTIYATAIVPEVAVKLVDIDFPGHLDRSQQAQRVSMPYRSVAEFMAERYHTSVDFLKLINPPNSLEKATIRSAILVPNVEPFRIELLAQGRTYKADPLLSTHWAVVDTQQMQLRIYAPLTTEKLPISGSRLTGNNRSAALTDSTTKDYDETKANIIAAYPITPGKIEFVRHGQWTMVNSVELPTWRYDPSLLQSGQRSGNSLTIPSGPNNPVGVHWMALSRSGIGIHGSDSPETIGRSRSAGCIRLSNWDVVKIPTLLRPGATVIIK